MSVLEVLIEEEAEPVVEALLAEDASEEGVVDGREELGNIKQEGGRVAPLFPGLANGVDEVDACVRGAVLKAAAELTGVENAGLLSVELHTPGN